jgi:uncharacterized protein YprB with RNaseH-like and TPR domain
VQAEATRETSMVVDGHTVYRTFEGIKEAFRDEEWIGLDLETTGFSPWKAKIAVIGLYAPRAGVVGVLHYPHGRLVPHDVLRWLESQHGIVTHTGAQFDMAAATSASL